MLGPQDVTIKSALYFETCDKEETPYTMAGLANAFGFLSVKRMVRFACAEILNPESSGAKVRIGILEAMMVVEDSIEANLYKKGGNAAGSIFGLRSRFGLDDNVDTAKPVTINITGVAAKL